MGAFRSRVCAILWGCHRAPSDQFCGTVWVQVCRWQLSSKAMPAIRTQPSMNLVFRDNRLNGWDVRDLRAFVLLVVTAEFRTAIAARPGTMMYHTVTRLRWNQRTSAFHTPSLTRLFASGFRPCRALCLLPRSVARRWQRRIPRFHARSALEFLEPFHQHQKTGACGRTAPVTRLPRNTVQFDQRSFAYTRTTYEFTNSEKTSSMNGHQCGRCQQVGVHFLTAPAVEK